MEIYIDILFLINFLSDFSLLSLCDIHSMKKKSIVKKVVSSLLGASYACLFVLDLPKITYSIFVKTIVMVIMCYIAFNPITPALLLEKCIIFLIASFLFCGIFYAGAITFDNPFFIYGMSDFIWIASLSIGFFMLRFLIKRIKCSLYSKNCKAIIYYNNKYVKLTGMIDSGNTLTEPFGNRPVFVIDEKILSDLFSPSATKNNLCEFVNPEDFKIIPYKTISNQGITCGFIPQKFIYEGVKLKDVIVAVAPSPISCDILISPQIL